MLSCVSTFIKDGWTASRCDVWLWHHLLRYNSNLISQQSLHQILDRSSLLMHQCSAIFDELFNTWTIPILSALWWADVTWVWISQGVPACYQLVIVTDVTRVFQNGWFLTWLVSVFSLNTAGFLVRHWNFGHPLYDATSLMESRGIFQNGKL